MKKKLTAILLALSVMASSGVVAFAAPNTVSTGAKSNANTIIYVKRPESLYDVTSDSVYTISATAKNGAKVSVYKKGSDNQYHKIYTDAKTVGASGLYTVTVNLANGANNFLLYAEGKAIEVQIVKVAITKSSGNNTSESNFSISSSHRPKPMA